jgi:predicted PurR-regulated permease PerM
MAYLWFILFVLSLITIGVLGWYIRNLISQFNEAIDNVSNMQEKIDEYVMHLDTVLSMETYYGDVTIENLLKHSKDLSDSLKVTGERFSISPNETKE